MSWAAARDAYVEAQEEQPYSQVRRGPLECGLHRTMLPVVTFVIVLSGPPADLVKHLPSR